MLNTDIDPGSGSDTAPDSGTDRGTGPGTDRSTDPGTDPGTASNGDHAVEPGPVRAAGSAAARIRSRSAATAVSSPPSGKELQPPAAPKFRCGHVGIIGRPNTGKSTLLNRLVGQALAITADRPQTTRHRILGVLTRPDAQLLLLDSPGLQSQQRQPLNQILARTAMATAREADCVALVVEANRWTRGDDEALRAVPRGTALVLVMNKLDRLRNPNEVLPAIHAASAKGDFRAIVPVSAQTGVGVDTLVDALVACLPEQPPIFPEDTLTDRSERFLAAEMVRERLFRLVGQEIPYQCTVVIDQFEQEGELRRIAATIVVERRSHKPILLGANGERIKRIATQARQQMETVFGGSVYLTLWVQVREGWAKDAAHLRSYGYE